MILICLILVFIQVWLELKMPDYMSQITVLLQGEGSKMKNILTNGGFMLLCAFGSLISAIITSYLLTIISSKFAKRLRRKIFSKTLNISPAEVKKFSISSLITRTTNDVNQVEMFLSMGVMLLFKAPITAIWGIKKILNKSWQWSALTAGAIVIILLTIGIIVSIVMPRFSIVQKLIDKVNRIIRENLTGIRVIRAFNAEKYQENKFNTENKKLTNTQLFNQKCFAVLHPVMHTSMNLLT